MELHGEMYDYYIMAAAAIGLIECFFGYRILRFILGVLGFIAGAVIFGSLGYELSGGSELISIAAGIAGGLAGAFITYTLYIVGVFAIGEIISPRPARIPGTGASLWRSSTPGWQVLVLASCRKRPRRHLPG